MKKKRILSLLLAVCLLFTAVLPVFAEETQENSDEIVANMYLCHTRSIETLFGHTWVYIENISNETLQIGAYACPPGQGVTVGTWALTRNDGWGIYYNLESYCINTFGAKRVRAMKDTLTRAELAKVSARVTKQNFWEFFFVNCSFYAAAVWNAKRRKKVVPFIHPTVVWLQIMLHGDVGGSLKMYYPARDQVRRHIGSGVLSTSYVVSDGTVSKKV